MLSIKNKQVLPSPHDITAEFLRWEFAVRHLKNKTGWLLKPRSETRLFSKTPPGSEWKSLLAASGVELLCSAVMSWWRPGELYCWGSWTQKRAQRAGPGRGSRPVHTSTHSNTHMYSMYVWNVGTFSVKIVTVRINPFLKSAYKLLWMSLLKSAYKWQYSTINLKIW